MFQTTNQVTIVLTASDPLINGKDPSDIAMALGPHSRRRLKDLGQIESGKAVWIIRNVNVCSKQSWFSNEQIGIWMIQQGKHIYNMIN